MTCFADMRWLTVTLVVFVGCTFDATISGSAEVTCTTSVDCRRGWACQRGTKTCVREELLDETPPSVAAARLLLMPRADNPLVAPTAFGPAVQVVLQLTFAEALLRAPEVSARSATDARPGVACSSVLTAPTSADATCSVNSSGGGDTTLRFEVGLIDLARNEATVVLPDVVQLDQTSPSPPPVDGGLFVRESPWGDEDTGLRPSTQVRLGGATLVDTVRLVFRRGVATLGEAAVVDGGIAPLELLRSDNSVPLQVAAIDPAGNVSTWVDLKHEEWLATFVGKLANESFPNPHRCEVVRAAPDALEGFPVAERGAADGVAVRGGEALEVLGAATWINANPGATPDGTHGLAAVVYDPLRSRVLHFGGARFDVLGRQTVASQTWEWTGRDWRQRVPTDPESDGNPEGRLGAAASWDPLRKAAIIAGGFSLTPLKDVWAWNGTSWRRLPDLPEPRFGGVLYFDTARASLVFFGGNRLASMGALPGAWRLEEQRWVAVDVPATQPRLFPSLTTVPQTGQNALLSGDTEGSMTLWYEERGEWLVFDAGVALPSPRNGAAAAWDLTRGVLVVHGGEWDGKVLDDVWELSDRGWRARTFDGGGPGPRSYHALSFDPRTGSLLLFGEANARGPTATHETWELNGAGWSRIATSSTPPQRVVNGELVWDNAAGALRALGESDGVLQNTWLSSRGWRVEPATGVPGESARLFDNALGVWLIASDGGAPAGLWRSETNGTWAPVVRDLGLASGAILGAAPVTGGGTDLLACCAASDDGGTTLAFVHTVGATTTVTRVMPPMHFAAVAAAGARGTAVIGRDFGEATSRLLFFDGNGLTEAGALPSALLSSAFAVSRERASVTVPGGVLLTGASSELLEYTQDGGWNALALADPEGDGNPLTGLGTALGVDQFGKLVALNREDPSEGVWSLSVTTERPAVLLRFALTQLPDDAVIVGGSLELVVGGSGGPPGNVAGVVGAARLLGRWEVGRTFSSMPSSTPEPVTIALAAVDLETLRRRTGELVWVLVPRGPNGLGLARLVVDSAALRLTLERK